MGHATWALYDVRQGQPAEHLHFRLTRDRWQAHRYCDVGVEGWTPAGTCSACEAKGSHYGASSGTDGK